MTLKTRYLGIKSYQETDKDLFFGREDEIREILHLIKYEKITVLYSQPGLGKSSLINAGIIPQLSEKSKFKCLNIPVKPYVDDGNSLIDSVLKDIKVFQPALSYLEKLAPNDNSLWYNFKRIQSELKDIEHFVLIFDQFETIFSYPEEQLKQFINELVTLLYTQIPETINESIREYFKYNPDFLTKEGFQMLYKTLDIKLFIAIRSDKLSLLNKLKDGLPGILNNCYELPAMSEEKAKSAIINPARFQPKFSASNYFITKCFDYEPDAVEKILNFLTLGGEKRIESFQLQIVCENIEKMVINHNYHTITSSIIGDVANIYKNYYDNLISQCADLEQQKATKVFIEDGLILEDENRRLSVYEGVALKKYHIKPETIECLLKFNLIKKEVSHNRDVFYELSHDALVFPILKAKAKRIESEIRLEEEHKKQQQIIELAEKQRIKIKKKNFILFIILLFSGISIVFGVIAMQSRIKAIANAIQSKSNMLAVYAFQELDKDPTVSFRIAEKAYLQNTSNILAYSALLHSFYKTNLFYTLNGRIDNNASYANLSNDGQKMLVIIRNENNDEYKVQLTDTNGDVFFELVHYKEITSAEMSPDGKLILTTSWDGAARVWNLKGEILQVFKGHDAPVLTGSFAPDCKTIVTAGNDYKAIIWNIKGEILAKFQGHDDYIYSAKFSPDGKYILTASGDNSARLWDITGKSVSIFSIMEDNRMVKSLAFVANFSPDGKLIVIVCSDYFNRNHVARIWKIEGEEIAVLRGHSDWLNNAVFTPDNKFVITTSRDKTAKIWDLNGRNIRTFTGHKSNVWNAYLDTLSKSLITVSEDKNIYRWELKYNQESNKNAKNTKYASFSPDGLEILTTNNETAKLWNLLGECLLSFTGHKKSIQTAIFSPDNQLVLTSSADSSAIIWRKDGNKIRELKGHRGIVNYASFSPDGKLIVTAGADSVAIIWNLEGNQVKKINSHHGKVNSAEFSPCGNYVLTSSDDSCAIISNLAGISELVIKGHSNKVNTARFSPKGKYIITTSDDKTARLWSRDGKNIFVFQGYGNKVNSAEFSPDGNFVVTASDDKTAKFWNLSGKEIMSFPHEGKVSNVTFSSNGKFILTIYEDLSGNSVFKLWLVDACEILKYVNDLGLYGKIWKLNDEEKRKFGIEN